MNWNWSFISCLIAVMFIFGAVIGYMPIMGWAARFFTTLGIASLAGAITCIAGGLRWMTLV